MAVVALVLAAGGSLNSPGAEASLLVLRPGTVQGTPGFLWFWNPHVCDGLSIFDPLLAFSDVTSRNFFFISLQSVNGTCSSFSIHTLSFVSILLSLPCITPLAFLLLMGHSPSPLAFVTLAGIQVMPSLAHVLAFPNSFPSPSSLRAQRIQLSHHFSRASQSFPCQQSEGLTWGKLT